VRVRLQLPLMAHAPMACSPMENRLTTFDPNP
jgi:hypothetical protein